MVAWNQPLECSKNEGLDRATMVQRGSFQGLAEGWRDLHGEENLCAHTMIVQELCKYINNSCTKIPVTVKLDALSRRHGINRENPGFWIKTRRGKAGGTWLHPR